MSAGLLLEHDPPPALPPDYQLPPVPFGRVLRLGSRGNDVKGVQRALTHAAFGKLSRATGVYLAGTVLNVRGFQKLKGLRVDGVYGPATHAKLAPFFDPYGFLLYTGVQPHPAPVHLQLPAAFTPTHLTAGLPGYPAVDCFAPAGASVGAAAAGTVVKLSGHDPREGGVPGGAYGWSLYVESSDGERYMTHFATRTVRLGDRVARGDLIGTVCDARVAHMATGLSHVHLGFRPAT